MKYQRQKRGGGVYAAPRCNLSLYPTLLLIAFYIIAFYIIYFTVADAMFLMERLARRRSPLTKNDRVETIPH